MGALEELERRIKRFEILVELIKESDRRLERRKIETNPNRNLAWSYLILSLVWLVGGPIVLLWIRRYTRGSVSLPVLPYFFLAFVLVSNSLIYILKTEKRKVEPEYYSLLDSFYNPLLSAFKEENFETLLKLADEVYSDPLVREALRFTHEGNPDEIAYSLYLAFLWKSGKKELEKELRALSKKKNLPGLIARLILESENV